jgi:nitrogen regulatory protein P-II 1
MKLAVLILNQEEHLENLLEGFIEIGITGSTIIDSIGMGHILSSDVPIFAGLRFMFAGSRPYNKTILSVVKKEKIEPLKKLVTKILGPLEESGRGIMFFIDISDVVGLKPEIV